MTDSQVTANVSNIPVIIIMSYGENRWEGKNDIKIERLLSLACNISWLRMTKVSAVYSVDAHYWKTGCIIISSSNSRIISRILHWKSYLH